jgi:isopenicillin-N epimerase
VTSPTALEFPVGDVTRRARQEGILTVIDGAHVPGQLDLNLDELGADFYGGNLHKWMCAPKGAGFLHAREEAQHLLKPLVVSWGYEAETPGPSQLVDHHEWSGTRDIAAFLSVPAAIEFQREHDWENVRAACRDLARETQERVEAMTGLPPLNAGSSRLQMVTVRMPEDVDLGRLKSRLYDEYHIEVPTIAWNGGKYLRVSYQGYNTRKDMERLLAALKEILQT